MICINGNINVHYCICNKRASTHRYHWKIITQSDNVKNAMFVSAIRSCHFITSSL